MSSALGLKICAITIVIKMYKSIKQTKAKMEAHLVIEEAKIRKCST